MSKKKNLLPPEMVRETFENLPGHKKPVSRRDFLATGLLPFSASLFLPTFGDLLFRSNIANAQNADCSAGAGGLSPFVTLNLSGGAMLAANFVPMDQGGQTLASYNKMGLGNSAVPIEREFANLAHFAGDGISKLLEGIRASTDAAVRGNTVCLGICVRSRDDSDVNKLDIAGLVAKAGLTGDLYSFLARRDGVGVKNDFALVRPPAPLVIGSYNDLLGSLGPSRRLDSLSQPQKHSLMKLVSDLSSEQKTALLGQSGGTMFGKLAGCALEKNIGLSTGLPEGVDPRQDAAIAQIWGLQANTAANAEAMVFGSMVYNGIGGNSGPVSLERGGYDYHNNTRTTGDTRDREAGVVIGRILATAAALKKPVFVYVTSDGACNAPVSDSRSAPWTSDRGSAGLSLIFAYHPERVPTTKNNATQIGYFTNDQSASDSFPTGGSPELSGAAAFANYLAFNGKLNLFKQVVGNVNLNLDQVVKIA